MAFVNLSILLGAAAVAVPIVLHLILRQQPKQVEFPALMFLRERREANRRRLQLRHWILLALRCLAVLLLVAALARPSVASALLGNWLIVGVLAAVAAGVALVACLAFTQNRGAWLFISLAAIAGILLLSDLVMLAVTLRSDTGAAIGEEEAPVAAVLLIDTAPRMQYRRNNQTRLEAAKDIAGWLMTQLPEDSDVAVADTDLGATVFAVDRGAARKTLEGLTISSLSRPLAEVLPDALDLARTSEKNRREIYLFTDLTEASWPSEAAAALRRRLDAAGDVSLYVVDVGAAKPENFALGEIALSKQMLSRNGELQLSTQLVHVGDGGQRVVELNVEKYDPDLPILKDGEPVLPAADPAKRRRQTVQVPADGAAAVNFSITGLDIGTHQGWLRLDRGDALAPDNVRRFTFEVREPWPVLVAAGSGTNAMLLTEALAPYEFRATDQARFRCVEVSIDQLANRELSDYRVVFLLDPPPLLPSVWTKLAAYAQLGGSVAIVLGHNARKDKFNEPAAQELLPGKLHLQGRSSVRPRDYQPGTADVYLSPRVLEHPMLSGFRDIADTVPWSDFPVFRYWAFENSQLGGGVQTVVSFSNGKPAIVERPLGEGRVLVATTPISDPKYPDGRETWNWISTGFEPWPYLMLVNEMALYLAGSGDGRLNYLTGQTAVLPEHTAGSDATYHLFTPRGGRPQTVRASEGQIRIPFTSIPGAYRLRPIEGGPVRGFSVNLPLDASDLTRTDQQRLNQLLGEGRYQLARQKAEIVREQGEQRVGREFYPFLLVLLAVVLGLEQALANRFYRKTDT